MIRSSRVKDRPIRGRNQPPLSEIKVSERDKIMSGMMPSSLSLSVHHTSTMTRVLRKATKVVSNNQTTFLPGFRSSSIRSMVCPFKTNHHYWTNCKFLQMPSATATTSTTTCSKWTTSSARGERTPMVGSRVGPRLNFHTTFIRMRLSGRLVLKNINRRRIISEQSGTRVCWEAYLRRQIDRHLFNSKV